MIWRHTYIYHIISWYVISSNTSWTSGSLNLPLNPFTKTLNIESLVDIFGYLDILRVCVSLKMVLSQHPILKLDRWKKHSVWTSSPGGRWFPVNPHEALVLGKLCKTRVQSLAGLCQGTKFLTLRSTLAHSPVLDAIVEQAENNQAWKFTETMAFSQSESGSPVRKMAG